MAGIFLRLDALTSSLWLDEFGTLWVAEGDFRTMLDRSWAFQGQSPLYYALPWAFMQLFGESEIALRAPSLLLGCLSLIAVYLSARAIAGAAAGLYATALFWLSVPGVLHTVEARPYSLVLFTVAVALAGFANATQFGTPRARLAWVLGGAAVAWAHYVFYPIVAGLIAAYAVLPALRRRYPIRRFTIDVVMQLALVALCSPQIVALIGRRGTLSWIPHFNYLVLLEPIWPLLIGIVVGIAQLVRRQPGSGSAALPTALLICVAWQAAAIVGASFLGINLLTGRYVSAILIPAVVFVGIAVSRATPTSAIAVLVVFAVATATVFQDARATSGTFSGLGYQDWRAAVDDLSGRIGREGNASVLFRSGFVEEDVIPLGTPPAAVFAPLRSPGRAPLPATVFPLTFRWTHPARQDYFDQVIAPAVERQSRFFVIGAKADFAVGNYMTKLVEWTESRWPAKYRIRRTGYGGVELLEFLSVAP